MKLIMGKKCLYDLVFKINLLQWAQILNRKAKCICWGDDYILLRYFFISNYNHPRNKIYAAAVYYTASL